MSSSALALPKNRTFGQAFFELNIKGTFREALERKAQQLQFPFKMLFGKKYETEVIISVVKDFDPKSKSYKDYQKFVMKLKDLEDGEQLKYFFDSPLEVQEQLDILASSLKKKR